MSEENPQQVEVEEQSTQNEERTTNDVVELEWTELSSIVNMRSTIVRIENDLANMMLAYEKRKLIMLDQISNLEDTVINTAKDLQKSKGLSTDDTYELKLPNKEGEKGYFIRKEQ